MENRQIDRSFVRIMLDTNVIISGLLFRNETITSLLDIVGGKHVFVLCSKIIDELSNLAKTKFQYASHIINKFLESNQADIWSSDNNIKLFNINNRDKNDEDIIKSAINSRCDILVSGDKDYFEKRYPNIDILTPRQFLFFFK